MQIQTDQTSSRYQKLIEISRDLASTLDLDLLLHRIVVAASELTSAEAASILLYDESKETLYFQAASNLDRPVMRGLIVPVDSSIAGWVVRNKQPVIVEDANADPRFYPLIQSQANLKTRDLIGVPLVAQNQVIGVVEAINKKHGAFEQDDIDWMMILAGQAAVAIENARLFAQSDLIAELVHEIRTPLASLNAASSILLRPDLPESQRQSIVLTIQSEVQRLSDLTTEFLDLARLESGRMPFEVAYIEPGSLLGECVGVTQSALDEKRIKLRWKVPDDLPRITGDRERLKQVFLNLLSNAVKYNREEGTITVMAGIDDNHLQITIEDTGRGIPPDSIPLIFDKFYRVPGVEQQASGTGLGLSIVKRIVEAHNGRIEVESDGNTGARFTVYFPLEA